MKLNNLGTGRELRVVASDPDGQFHLFELFHHYSIQKAERKYLKILLNILR